MTVTREIKIVLTPPELAELFCGLFDDDQAEFFEHVGLITKAWPGAGWCQQACSLSEDLSDEGREVIRTLASHALNRDDL